MQHPVDFLISWMSVSGCPIDPGTTLTTVQLTFVCFWWHILTHGCPQVAVLDWRGLSMFGREKTFWGLPWGTFLQRGDGRGGFLLLCFSPHHVHTRDQQKRNSPDTELQLGHTTHARKAFRGHLRLREISCWVPQRDGGELIFLFSPQPNKGGAWGKGGGAFELQILLQTFSWQFFFFFFWKLGEANLRTFSVWGLFLTLVKKTLNWSFCLVSDFASLSVETSFGSHWSSENEGIPGNPAEIGRKVQKRSCGRLRKNFDAARTFFKPCYVWKRDLMKKTCHFPGERHN